jgi:hypothetical protein
MLASMYQTSWIDDVSRGLLETALEHGAFLRREVIALGLDDRVLRRQLRAGTWVRVRHGAYTFADIWTAADADEQHRIRMRAANRILAERVVFSHHSSCLAHGLPVWGADLSQIHVTRSDGGAGRNEGDVRHHEGLLLPDDVTAVEGVRTTRPVRAVLESASLLTVEQGLAVVDAGLHEELFDKGQLFAQQRLMESWPGCQHLQLVTRLSNGLSGSVGESRSRYLFWVEGLPSPEAQFEIRDGSQVVAAVDFAWPDHKLIVEFDGKEKYVKYLLPGETPADAVFREKKREDLIRRLTGWTVIRMTWADLRQPKRMAAIIRAAMNDAR